MSQRSPASRVSRAVRIATEKWELPQRLAMPIAPQYALRGPASRASITCIARTFGAPVTDPGGKHAAKVLESGACLGSLPDTSATD